MHIHIIGICGTFMTGIALIARQLGHHVTGCDENIYPPMSDVLAAHAISIELGFSELPKHAPDLYVIGNAAKRGMPVIEHILNKRLPFTSGPQWLHDYLLKDKRVVAVAGTHGKTTTSSLLSWVLHSQQLNPGFLIGGAPLDFEVTARVTESPLFVIEADEYDTAFFDKRSKFVHYQPEVAIINNLEYDHADIFDSLAAIQAQFHGLVRLLPQQGLLIHPNNQPVIDELLAKGCWTPRYRFGNEHGLHAKLIKADGSEFEVWEDQTKRMQVAWPLIGEHNIHNALAVTAACRYLTLDFDQIAQGLSSFKGVKRRMEFKGEVKGISLWDDFAHHPSAIQTTVSGLRKKIGDKHLVVILEFASFSMRHGVGFDKSIKALSQADNVYLLNTPQGAGELPRHILPCAHVHDIECHLRELPSSSHVLIMSNRGTEHLFNHIKSTLVA